MFLDVRDELSRRGLLTALGVAGMLGAAGCAQPGGPAATGPVATRSITHPLGTGRIPVAPRRVVSLDSNGALQVPLELGAPLVASETLQGDVSIPGYLPAPPPGFASLGFNQLNLERIAALHPDLILGNVQRLQQNYATLSAIAPTVSYANAGRGVDWRESVRVVGDALGARAAVDARLDAYAEQVGALAKARAGAIARYSVALLRFTGTELRIVRGEIFGASILAHAGVRRPPSTNLPGENLTYVSLSQENLGVLADSDVLLYVIGGGGSAKDAAADVDRYTAGGLWSGLPAVRAGRVVALDPVAWWDGYSVSAAQRCLTELDAALAKLG